jgi:Fic-DOC domain mobile mystery protein B
VKLVHAPGATPLDPDEVVALIPSSVATQAELNDFEQANILEAERWALSRRRRACLTDAFMRGLHRRMFGQVWRWAGRYRRSDKNIGVPWPQVAVKVASLCLDTQHWIEHRACSWDELAARFHHRLVSIHPFSSGNGRHARLMTDVLLASHDQPSLSWGQHSLTHPGEARAQYIAALQAADGHNLVPLIAFVRR